jgi:hypothetical protein
LALIEYMHYNPEGAAPFLAEMIKAVYSKTTTTNTAGGRKK